MLDENEFTLKFEVLDGAGQRLVVRSWVAPVSNEEISVGARLSHANRALLSNQADFAVRTFSVTVSDVGIETFVEDALAAMCRQLLPS